MSGHDRVMTEDVPIGGNWSRPVATAFQGALDRVPCAGSGPLNLDLRNRAYRDCSGYSKDSVEALPWITRDTIDTAVAALGKGVELAPPGPPPSRVPVTISGAVSGGLLVALVGSYVQYDKYSQRTTDYARRPTIDRETYEETRAGRDRWGKLTIGLTAAVITSGAFTMFLWQRDAPARSFSVQPTASGAAVTFGGDF